MFIQRCRSILNQLWLRFRQVSIWSGDVIVGNWKKKEILGRTVGRSTVSCHASFDVQFAVNPGWKLRASINATLDYRIPWTGLTDLNEKRKQLFDEILYNVFTREGYSGPGPKRYVDQSQVNQTYHRWILMETKSTSGTIIARFDIPLYQNRNWASTSTSTFSKLQNP